MTKRSDVWLMLPVLLLAAALRWAALPEMTDMLGFDESAYAADAAAWLAAPRPTPFFPANNGREGGWIYLLAGFAAGAGLSPFTVRLAAAFVGVLTVAATYRLGGVMFGRRAGLGAAASMAVLYWPVHLSHIAMRANLLPALGALSLAFLLGAVRSRQPGLWGATGLSGGLLIYSYTSAYVWAALVGLLLLVFALRGQRGARGAFFLMVGIALPMAIYAWQHPNQVLQRAGQSAVLSGPAVLGALDAWLRAWLVRGDILLNHNIPGRPILDPAASALFAIGLLSLARRARWQVSLIGALAGISILPSLLSEFPPHFLRSIGLTVPIALVMGLGAAALPAMVSALTRPAPAQAAAVRAAGWVAVGLITITAAHTARDFRLVWLKLPAIDAQFERPIHRAVEALRSGAVGDPNAPIYFVPYELTHPVIQFSRHRLAGQRVGAFDGRACLVVSQKPATYVVAQDMMTTLAAALEPWGRTSTHAQRASAAILQLSPEISRLIGEADWVTRFGGALEARATTPAALAVARGERLTWLLRVRALRPLPRPYSLFVHLYRVGEDGSADEGRKWAQGDQQICASYPTTLWQADEVIIQPYHLVLPGDLPAGRYQVAIGIYDSESGERLSNEDGTSYAVMTTLLVD